MKFIKNNSEIVVCDIGASPCDPTTHLEELLNNTTNNSMFIPRYIRGG